MPDIGGFGRGLLKGALSATEKAAEKVKEAAEAASRKMTDDDPDATQVVRSDPDTTRAVPDESDPDATQVIKVEDPDATQVVRTTTFAAPATTVPAATPLRGSGPSDTVPPVAGPPTGRPSATASQVGGPSAAVSPVGGSSVGGRSATVSPVGGSSAGRQPATASQVAWASTSGSLAAAPPVAGPPVGGPPVAMPLANGPSVGGQPAAGPRGSAPSVVAPVDAPPAEPPASAPDDEAGEHADASDVRELVEMFQQLLARRRPPAGPIPGDWSVGVGDLLAEHPKVPKRVRGLITKLNRFGGVGYSPQEVSFDGDDVPWEKVTEVRTRHIIDYLVGDAVQQQVENLPMPWFPGRQRLLDALGQALLTVTIATAKDQLDGLDVNFRIPAEIVYKGSFGRSKELNAGVVSALVLSDPAVNQSLVATAQARGITVTASEDEMLANADERAEQIREKVKALEAELDRFTKRFGRKPTDG